MKIEIELEDLLEALWTVCNPCEITGRKVYVKFVDTNSPILKWIEEACI